MLTRLVVMLLLLAMLPLGSLAAKVATAPRAVAVISAQLADTTVAATAKDNTFASVAQRCKGPALPGAPCHPALADWPAPLLPGFASRATALTFPRLSPGMIGHTPPLPPVPPRLA